MFPNKQSQTLYDKVTPVAVVSSTDASPAVITATAHGFTTGQRVLIYGHATNVALNGIFLAVVLTANTFSLQDEFTKVPIAGSGAGAGSGGIAVVAPPVLLVADFRNIIFQVGTEGTATVTLKFAGSLGRSAVQAGPVSNPRGSLPNMGATVTPENPYAFIQIIPLDTQVPLAGATGIVVAGTDVNNNYEMNTNSMVWVTVIPTSWTAGAITIKALSVTNNA